MHAHGHPSANKASVLGFFLEQIAFIYFCFRSQDLKNTNNNRGFAFIDYFNHACAEYSRLKMMNPKFKLSDNAPTVSWADPKNADSSAASQVLILISSLFKPIL